jgi:transcriptional regulator with XRE-family HTH domain
LQDAERKIGAKVRELREKGWNQDEFAERAGLNRIHLYRVETGQQSPTIRTLSIIATALDLRIRDLVEDV